MKKLGNFCLKIFCITIAAAIFALRAAILLFGIDIFNLREIRGIEPPSDDEIFDIARRICPVCRLDSEDEAEEIGYYAVSNELALKCLQCGTVFLGTVRGEILPITEIANIRPLH